MGSLVPEMVLSILPTLVMTLLYFYLYIIDRKSFLSLWSGSWMLFALASLIQGVVFHPLALLGSAFLLGTGMYFFVEQAGRLRRRVQFYGSALCLLWVMTLLWEGYRGMAALTPAGKAWTSEGDLFSFSMQLLVPLGTLLLYWEKVRLQFNLQLKDSHQLEEHLRKSEGRLKSIIQHQPACIKTVAPDGTLLTMNPAGLAILEASYCPEKVIGQNIFEFIHPEDRKDFIDLHRKACSGQSGIAQFRVIDLLGHYRWMESYSVPLHFNEGATDAVLSVTHDITERKQTEQKLIQSYEELKAAKLAAEEGTKAKSKFLAHMSHEIRTPIGAILGFAELLLKRDLSFSERSEFVNTILSSGRQLLEIIDEILDISKVEAGRLEIEIMDMNINHLLRDLWTLMRLKADTKGIGLNFILKSTLPEHILCDPIRLRQILLNILSNAVKFTDRGQVTVEISWDQGRFKFRVRDTGVGIEPEEVKKLFQSFSQVSNSISRRFGGTGLGLALARTMAESLGGDVYLESSEAGSGSTFVAEIAAEAVENSPFISDIERLPLEVAELNGEPQSPPLLSGIKVLVVEDSPINQTLIRSFLKAAGAQVDIANNGKEGYLKALSENFDIVLMDIQMPEMDGYEATTKLRAQGYQGPIIALTAHAMKEERELCLKAGMTDFLSKPIDRNLLISKILQLSLHPHCFITKDDGPDMF